MKITDEQIIQAAEAHANDNFQMNDLCLGWVAAKQSHEAGAKWMQEQMQREWIPVSEQFPPFNTPVMLRGVISWKSQNSVSYFSDEVQVDSEILEYGQSGHTLKFNNDYLVCNHPNPEELMSEYITHWKLLIEPPTK